MLANRKAKAKRRTCSQKVSNYRELLPTADSFAFKGILMNMQSTQNNNKHQMASAFGIQSILS